MENSLIYIKKADDKPEDKSKDKPEDKPEGKPEDKAEHKPEQGDDKPNNGDGKPKKRDDKHKKIIDLTKAWGIREKGQCKIKDWPGDAKFCFGLASSKRTWYFYGSDDEDVK